MSYQRHPEFFIFYKFLRHQSNISLDQMVDESFWPKSLSDCPYKVGLIGEVKESRVHASKHTLHYGLYNEKPVEGEGSGFMNSLFC